MSDIVVEMDCGCVVVFSAESQWCTSRMEACGAHNGRDQTDDRTSVVASARVHRDRLLVQQN